MNSMTVQAAKHDLAQRTRCGLAYILAGVLLWMVFGVLGLALPDSPRNGLIYLFGAGLLWPLGLAIGAVLASTTWLLARADAQRVLDATNTV